MEIKNSTTTAFRGNGDDNSVGDAFAFALSVVLKMLVASKAYGWQCCASDGCDYAVAEGPQDTDPGSWRFPTATVVPVT